MARLHIPASSRVGTILVLIAFSAVNLAAQVNTQRETTRVNEQAGQQTMALNPLTAEEKRAAEGIALADPRVARLLGTGRRQLISVELFPIKPDAKTMEEAAAGRPIVLNRVAEVIFLRYDNEAGVRAIVDLSRHAAIEATEIAADQVPLTEADLAEASRLALADAEVSRALGQQASRFRPENSAESATQQTSEQFVIQGLPVRASDAKDSCWKHRCLYLLFRAGNAYLTRPVVIVDLTSHQVRVQSVRTERNPNENPSH